MALYFLDTSAIVKRYFPEKGHVWIANLCDPEQKPSSSALILAFLPSQLLKA